MTFWQEYCKKYGNEIYPVISHMTMNGEPKFIVRDGYAQDRSDEYPINLDELCDQCEQMIGEPYCLRHDPDTDELTDGPITRSDALYILHTTLAAMLKNLYFSRLTREECCNLCNILLITGDRNLALTDELRYDADSVSREWNVRHPNEKKIERQGIDYPS